MPQATDNKGSTVTGKEARIRVMYYDGGIVNPAGGSVMSLLALATQMRSLGVEPRVLCCFDHETVAMYERAGVPIERLWRQRPRQIREEFDSYGKIVKNIAWTGDVLGKALRISWYLRRHEIDLVHTNNDIVNCAPAIVAARLCCRPCVCHLRGLEVVSKTSQWLARLPQVFIAVSKVKAEHYARSGVPADRIVVIFNSVNLHRMLPPPPTQKAGDGGPVVGMFDRFEPGKGFEFLPDLVFRVKQRCPRVQFRLVGYRQGGVADEVRRRLEKELTAVGVAEAVRIMPYTKDALSLMREVDVVIRLALKDNLARTLFEAMSVGTPIVSFSRGASEALTDGQEGYLVEPGDTACFANKLCSLLVDGPRRTEMGKAARQTSLTLFDPHVNARRVVAIYQELHERRRFGCE